jgi:UDP-N-acetylglucosamine acyltransferase
MIHPTAVIHPQAKLGNNVQVGPHVVIDAEVELGADSVVGPHVYLTGRTVIGVRNQFHAGCVIGGAPQDLKYKGEPTRLRIGDDNTFREHVTVNRSTTADGETVLGSHNFLMAGSHVGHNSVVGDHVIMANCSALGGHVLVQDRVFISAYVGVHQFVRVGTLAMTQGGTSISQDLPPFTMAHNGLNRLCGLNTLGLRRAGVTAVERLELKRVYQLLFRSGKNLRAAVEEGRREFAGARAKLLLEFVAESKRGVCRHLGAASGDGEEE